MKTDLLSKDEMQAVIDAKVQESLAVERLRLDHERNALEAEARRNAEARANISPMSMDAAYRAGAHVAPIPFQHFVFWFISVHTE